MNRKVKELTLQGWREVESFPAAGIVILMKNGRYCTVTKSGAVKDGRHAPR